MAENMQFIPRQNVLTLEEMFRLAQCFVALGVQKIRLTGGEPLVRNGIVGLCQNIAALSGLKELCMSTNGSQLSRFAKPLHDAGVSRLNISLDSLNGQRFKELTRTGDLARVIAGIDAASAAGFRHTKLNCVVLKGRNDDEVVDLVQFAIDRQLDISFIEEMPLGIVSEHQRSVTYCSSDEVRARLGEVFTLIESTESTLGPSRYWRLAQAPATRVGFISPHSHNFCGSCNRVRLTAEGRLLLCLGNEHSSDLKDVLRNSSADNDQLVSVIRSAINLKPYSHQFNTDGDVQILRFMNMTGG
jgi:cyclic pyranopterin phosphate synthase